MGDLAEWIQQEILCEYAMQNTINTDGNAFKTQQGQDYADWQGHELQILRLGQCAKLEAEKATMHTNMLTVVKASTGIKAQLVEIEAERDGLRAAICIHMVEEVIPEIPEDCETDAVAIAAFLNNAAEFEPDISIADKLRATAQQAQEPGK